MADSVAAPGPRARSGEPAHGGDGPADSFDELRALLVGPEQRELMALQAHLLDPAIQVRDVSRVLPDAIALRSSDPQLTRALAPSIESALTASVQRDPRPLADALFPVMGPAIRKAIAHTLASMMETLNRTVEHSVSWRAVQWRWTALRTGRPFAEIVLLNTLQYRVEQVFLIHRETGLLLQHVSSDLRSGQDADQISAMLTAITDFVRDSFATEAGDTLDALRVGDLSVSIEEGPRAILACVVRGSVPYSVRSVFQNALESVHLQLGPELEAFKGDSAGFERARPILETCLVTQYRGAARKGSYRRWVVVGAVLLLAVGVWAFLAARDRRRWTAYVDRLRAEPGVVVLASERRGGKFFVGGLRDPLARDPATLVASTGLDPRSIDSRWEPYQALHPPFVAARARDLLRPPATVTLAYDNGVLTASGAASERWILESERIAPAIAGVRRFEYTGTPPAVQLKNRIEELTVLFPKGQSKILPGQAETVRQVSVLLNVSERHDPRQRPQGGRRSPRAYRYGRNGSRECSSEPEACRSGGRHPADRLARRARLRCAWSGQRGGSRKCGRHDGGGEGAQPARLVPRDPAGCRGGRGTPPVIQKKICMLGGFGVGKTSLVSRYVHSLFSDQYLTTVGVKIEKKTVDLENDRVDLMIWDLYGEDDFQKIRTSYLRGSSGFLLVADGTRRSTLATAIALQETAERAAGHVPFLLLVNKADLSERWEIDDAALAHLKGKGWQILRTSAKTGLEVETAFADLARAMLVS